MLYLRYQQLFLPSCNTERLQEFQLRVNALNGSQLSVVVFLGQKQRILFDVIFQKDDHLCSCSRLLKYPKIPLITHSACESLYKTYHVQSGRYKWISQVKQFTKKPNRLIFLLQYIDHNKLCMGDHLILCSIQWVLTAYIHFYKDRKLLAWIESGGSIKICVLTLTMWKAYIIKQYFSLIYLCHLCHHEEATSFFLFIDIY